MFGGGKPFWFIQFCKIIVQEMTLKDISYPQLWRPISSAEGNHLCKFGRGHYEKHFCKIIVQDMTFKDISYLPLWRPIHSDEGNQLYNFGREYYQKHFCKVIVLEEMHFKDILYLQLWRSIGSEGNDCAILVDGFMRNISVKLLFRR